MVFRSPGAGFWQLADACVACTQATPHAAQLPPAPDPEAPWRELPRRSAPAATPTAREVESLLTYLEAALEPATPATAHLFALLCLLRADAAGVATLQTGLLRSWRLATSAEQCITELIRQQWLHQPTPDQFHIVRIADTAGTALLRSVSRRQRARILDRAAQFLRDRRLHARTHGAWVAALHSPTEP